MPPKRSAPSASNDTLSKRPRTKEDEDHSIPWDQEETVSIRAIDRVIDAMMDQLSSLIDDAASPTLIPNETSAVSTATSPGTSKNTTTLNDSIMRQGLWQLRTWQRGLWKHCVETDQACRKASATALQREQAWAALQYETHTLHKSLARIQTFDMPNLTKVLDQQQQQRNPDGSQQQSTDTKSSLIKAVDDPQQRPVILQQLQDERTRRQHLEAERTRLQKELQDLKQASVQNATFLTTTLPKHLQTLSNATKPLQSWLANPTWTGSARQERFRLAQDTNLSTPLFTLFVTLQECVDQLANTTSTTATSPPLEESSTPPSSTLKIVVNQYRQEVQWSLPVPEVGVTSKARHVTLHFQCTPKPAGARCITATVTGAAAVLDQSWLLVRLFPNDSDEEEYDNDDNKTLTKQATKNTKPFYRWAHYLAGIHLVPSHSTASKPHPHTTAMIVQTLQRRVRAHAILKHMLTSLQQRKLPSPTAGTLSTWVVVSWKEFAKDDQKPTKPGVVMYEVVCRQGRSNSTADVKARVCIDKAAYPGVPPVWELDRKTSNTGYDAAMADLERVVNHDLLVLSPSSNTGDEDKDVRMSDNNAPAEREAYSEWILAHQLNRLLEDWETVVNAASATLEGGSRTVRGRDRAIVKTTE